MFLSLTAMRGVAALLVAFFHLRFGIIGIPFFDYYMFSFRFGNKGYLWVDFFFILSGFILTYRYRDVCRRLNLRGYADFIWHRFARIWPLHFVTLVAAVLYLGHRNGIAYVLPSAVIANLFLVHGWGHYFPPPLNFPSWSLSDEWGAYLVLPLYLFAIVRIRSRIVHVLLVVVLFAGLAWYAKVFGHGTLDLLRERGGLERCLFQVGIGASLFQLYDFAKRRNASRSRKTTSQLAKLFDAAAALVFTAIFFVFTYTNNDLYFVPLAGALIFCLSLSQGPFSNFLSVRPMVLLGEISFSIYMLHAFVLWLLQDIPLSYKAHVGWWTGAFFLLTAHLLVLVLAYLSYKGIERPAHRLLVSRRREAGNHKPGLSTRSSVGST